MLNKVQLIGRLGQDPEIKRLENGTPVARLSLATSEKWKDKDGNMQEATEWHNIVLWRGIAEVAQKYCRKGDLIYIEGSITTRKWVDDGGQNRYTTEIKGDKLTMLAGKRDAAATGAAPMPSAEDAPPAFEKKKEDVPPAPKEGDDLPF